jgi:putative Holliday junction resolvase
VGGIVVGLPLTLAGVEGEAVQAARRLGVRLARLGLPLEYADERLTTWAADEAAREASPPRGPRRSGHRRERATDDLAAAMLLQRFLDERREQPGGRAGEDGEQPGGRAGEHGERPDARA